MPDARLLILGSMPGAASLAAHEYYAHPRNAFWRVLETLWSIPADAPYAVRAQALMRGKVAIWDVLARCERRSSLDADIKPATIEPNDFAGFFRRHPAIERIAFNGAAARQLYERHVLPRLAGPARELPLLQLPSTSPANARLSLADKQRAWAVLAAPA